MSIKILTVDDSKTIRLIIAKAFKPYDCAVVEAANGVEGLAAAVKEKPDIILLDLTMPVMDGYETLTKLKSEANLKDIPVIMLTAEAGKDNVLRIAKLGVKDYIVKPFKEEALVEKVGKVVKLAPASRPPAAQKNYADALQILVVDDKPAIIEQITEALKQTPWKVQGVNDTKAALEHCGKQAPDALLVSLSLPNGSAFSFFSSLAANPQLQSVPVVGVCVKTATAEQEQAAKAGFAGIVTKPIVAEDLHDKIVQVLQLNTSDRYFQQKDGILILTTPPELTASATEDVLRTLPAKIAEIVDSGLNKVIVHVGKTRTADWNLVKIAIKAVSLCKELGLRFSLVGSDQFGKECENYPEAANLNFVYNINDALASFRPKEQDEAA